MSSTFKAWALGMVPFAILLWVMTWLVRFLPRLNKKSALSSLVQLMLAICVGGDLISQIVVYRDFVGNRALARDHVFLATFYIECFFSFWLGFKSYSVRRRKENEAK